MYMAQLNINVTPQFERDLVRFMRLRGLRTKSEAIRLAIREGVERVLGQEREVDFAGWIGVAEGKLRGHRPRFKDDDDLWSR